MTVHELVFSHATFRDTLNTFMYPNGVCRVKVCRSFFFAFLQGRQHPVDAHLAHNLPALSQCGKKAVAKLVESRPDFHPLSGWTHVKQLHDHKVIFR